MTASKARLGEHIGELVMRLTTLVLDIGLATERHHLEPYTTLYKHLKRVRLSLK